MALYRVIVPYGGSSGQAAAQYTTVEVEAESESEAKRLALVEFEEMAGLGPSGERPRPIQREVRIERAPIARRSSLEIFTNELGPAAASARLVGSLNAANFDALQQALDGLKDRGVSRLVLDLSGLAYVNSTGLSLFVAAGDLFDLRLAVVPARIGRLFRMIGLDKFFPTFTTVAEAAKAPPRQ
jgi:anti-anti-sigma factor